LIVDLNHSQAHVTWVKHDITEKDKMIEKQQKTSIKKMK